MSVPRLYVPAIETSDRLVSLPPDEAHHVTRVLRLGVGAKVRVFDGRGREWAAHLVSAGRRSTVAVEIEDEVATVPEPSVRVTLAAGILKGDHMDAIVRDATMMGVVEIVPLASKHVTVPRKAWGSPAALERWRRVAVASAKQCGRAVVPEIRGPADLTTLLGAHAAATILMFVEPSQGAEAIAVSDLVGARPTTALVLVGPEGGWSREEISQARAAGATLVYLGLRTIRADAMATAALAALWVRWGE